MLPIQCVKTRWNSRNMSQYISKGYVFTKYNEQFWVDIKDIQEVSPKSTVRITIQCDYCGLYLDRSLKQQYRSRKNSATNKDCCVESKCIVLKTEEENYNKLGVKNPMMLKENSNKTSVTMLERHGVENASQMSNHNEKVKQTSLEKYGVEHPQQSEKVIDKRRATNLIRYGHINAAQSDVIREKIAKTYESKGTVRTSSQQLSVFDILLSEGYNVKLNYPVSTVNIDMGLFSGDVKIAVEYDGWYWHQDAQKDRKRDEFLKSKGWKVLRIKSGKKLPSIERLNEQITKLLTSSHTYKQIVLDDWKTQGFQSSKKIV